MPMDVLFLREHELQLFIFKDEMRMFLGRDCDFLRTSWLFHNIGRDGNFRTRLSFFSTSWQFHNLGQDGHLLSNFAK